MKQKLLLLINLLFFVALSAQEVPKNIFVEHFTNTRCSVCASKNPTFYNTIANYEKVIHLAYHPSSPYSSCVFSQHNISGNDDRTNELGIYGSTPRVAINGIAKATSSNLINNSDLDAQNNLTTPFDIQINQYQVGNDSMYAEIIISTISASNISNASLYVALAEETINYNAPNGENVHHDVFRRFLSPNSGVLINLPSNGSDTTILLGSIIDQEWKGGELITTAFIKAGNGTVLQAQQSNKLDFTTGISIAKIINKVLYPNPARDFLYINNETQLIDKIEVYNILGSKVKELILNDVKNAKLSVADLNEGNYIVRVYDKNNDIHTTKIVVDY